MPSKKYKGAKKPRMVHKNGPFIMTPTSKEIYSPGPFKANEPAMMFKNNMPKSAGLKALAEKNPELEYVGNKPKIYGKPKMMGGYSGRKKPKMDHK